MKILVRGLAILSVVIMAAIVLTNYQRYKYRTTDQSVKHYTAPLINLGLNAIVTDKAVTDVLDRIQSSNAMTYSLRIEYIDIHSKQKSDFLMNMRYQQRISIGDTVAKKIGDEFLILRKKDGTVLSLPIK